jgi:hypothetical protein
MGDFQTVIASRRLGTKRPSDEQSNPQPQTPHDGLLRRKGASQ